LATSHPRHELKRNTANSTSTSASVRTDRNLWRRRSFGTQSERGHLLAERLMTMTQTARKQRRYVFTDELLLNSSRNLNQRA
jgi:hypothetical protein